MKVSLNLAQYYANDVSLRDQPLNELLDKIGGQLGAIEEVTLWGPRFDGIVVAKVVSCVKHPDADKLSVCTIDDGGITPSVNRDAKGLVQVVCGAPNAREGLTVAWIPPGKTVPSTLDKDPFKLEVREIRGVKSNGMLASPAELGISDNHDGILEINAEEVGEELMKPGTPFKQLYGLDDVVIDIENKMFTHRPDCFGNLGVARELAGITGQKFASPDWYIKPLEFKPTKSLNLKVDNEIPELVPRFTVAVLSDVAVKPSPLWMQSALTRVGIKPINNVVDITNFVMHLTGQPLHAFDYDKLVKYSNKASLMPRMSKKGEKLVLLGKKEIELTGEEMVIATDKQAVALAGVMGGAETEVDDNTKNIVLEVATFDMYSIRRTSMRHGLFTEAVTRFNKGQSPQQNMAVIAYAIKNLQELAGAEVAAEIADFRHDIEPAKPVNVELSLINDVLGTGLDAKTVKNLLQNVEFEVTLQGSGLQVSPPFWRTDIEIPEDVVEEVGRLYGYDNVSQELPLRSTAPVPRDPLLTLAQNIRSKLSAVGANEVLTYSFVHGELLRKVGQDPEVAYTLANALSPDLEHYRLSLTPSLLEKVYGNIRSDMVRGDDNEFAIFELGKAHVKGEPDPHEPAIPKEVNALSLVFAADGKTLERKYAGVAYYHAKKYLSVLLMDYGVYGEVTFEPLEGANLYKNPFLEQMVKPYEPKRSAVLRDREGMVWGVVGEFRAVVKRELKLPDYCAGFEIDPLLFILKAGQGQSYVDLPKYPKIRADITFRVPAELSYGTLFDYLWQQLDSKKPDNTFATLGPVDIYQSDKEKKTKNVTLRLWLSAYDRTLQIETVNTLLDKVAADTKAKFGATRI